MKKILIIDSNSENATELDSVLTQTGFTCLAVNNASTAVETIKKEAVDIILMDADGLTRAGWFNFKSEQLPIIKSAASLPVIVLMPRGFLDGVDSNFDIDDFVARPYNTSELVTRIKRVMNRANKAASQDSIRCGDLVVDLARCEVTVNGRLVALTFKEYELLKSLIRHKGKVFTREALLDDVWGYDYYGGDRTVDVHIRRLRSKIEDSDHTFIETVRNIGYKFIS